MLARPEPCAPENRNLLTNSRVCGPSRASNWGEATEILQAPWLKLSNQTIRFNWCRSFEKRLSRHL
jgi:hypothetical protein